MTEFFIEQVSRDYLPQLWPRFSTMLEEQPELWALYETPESILESLLVGQLQLWVLLRKDRQVNLTALTRVSQHARGLTLHVVWAKGQEARDAVMAISGLEQLARNLGCTNLEILGRDGWRKLLAPYGYKKAYEVLGKKLDPPDLLEMH